MRIGVISDTHGFLDDKITGYFSEVDEVWHAGDVGSVDVITKLQTLKPLVAVYGNIDGAEIRRVCPDIQYKEIDGVKILMLHIAGPFQKYNAKTKELINHFKPHVLVCGHSHICKVAYDKVYNLLYVNPGAAGNHGFHAVKTILRFSIQNSKVNRLEVIELGKRGMLS